MIFEFLRDLLFGVLGVIALWYFCILMIIFYDFVRSFFL